MKELLYKKSEAVAALNRIDGFNPMELMRKICDEGQEEQLYLDVKYRKLWFRLVHPLGKIISHVVNLTDYMAVVEARIYLDKADTADSYIANSFSQKFRSDDPKFGDKFLEMAETAAIGRALADAGFGVQFADVGEENDPAQVDAGISLAQQNFTQQTMMNGFYQQAQATGNTVGQPAGVQPNVNQATQPQNFQPQTPQPIPVTPALDAAMPVEELVKCMSYEQATQMLIGGNGKFGKMTMGQVAIESPGSLNWFANEYTGNNHLVPAAARVILQRAMPTVA